MSSCIEHFWKIEVLKTRIKAFTDSINTQATQFKAPFEFLTDPRQRRRKCPFLKKIVEMTRANSTLYNKAIESIKNEFKVAPLHSQPFIASLRSSLLMALHESEHQEMVSRKRDRFSQISRVLERIPMEHIESNLSLECKLFFLSICSVWTRSRTWDIQFFRPEHKVM